MARLISHLARPVLLGILMMLLGTGLAFSAEQDDSNLFVEAFTAYQKKDYLLAIEKITLLNQAFPDSPLRDVALLLLARSGLKAGDSELAAKTTNQFESEYADNPLRATVEEELWNLGGRLKKGEKLLPNRQLRAAAQKVRKDQLAAERALALKAEQQRLAREKAEQDRIAREKAEAERKERERLAAEKAAKASIKLALAIPGGPHLVESGRSGQIPFELTNRGTAAEEFLISTSIIQEYDASLAASDKPEQSLQRVSLAPGEAFKGVVTLRMPAGRVDGYKVQLPLTAVSAKYSDVRFSKETQVVATAPLVRVVAKPINSPIGRGKVATYRITVLNAGSQPARGLTVRTTLPPQVDFVEASGSSRYRQESAGVISFPVESLESGTLCEFQLNVKIRESTADKQELRCQVEVINGRLQLKDIFNSHPVVVAK